MSRIGKLPVAVPDKVKLNVASGLVSCEGPKGKLQTSIVDGVDVQVDSGSVTVKALREDKKSRANHGLMRALIANMVEGVSEGFVRKMEIIGVGYRVQLKGKALDLTIGKSHPVIFDLPQGIEAKVTDPTHFEIVGIDKQQVGQVAANIRSLYPPEPYKGKGIRYEGEYVRKKAGKSAA